MSRRAAFIVALLFGCCGAAAAQVASQSEIGGLTGVVVDDGTGAPIEGALVQVHQTGRSTTTDPAGHFAFKSLPSGSYDLSVSVVGYILVKRTVDLTSGQSASLVIALAAGTGTYREEVTVHGDSFPSRESAITAQQV